VILQKSLVMHLGFGQPQISIDNDSMTIIIIKTIQPALMLLCQSVRLHGKHTGRKSTGILSRKSAFVLYDIDH